ncbi:hypothetical protein BFP70_00675 [Thioclava sp. SK-1]|uniref:hypothetical protein n=1 Tax=Thioclava sp. SK-1 TaxID=1889770 RepID=UPI000825A643|nr:hypothetical protein [Thioclava sp. SK-1]OCX66707.1 hypothetical protein BFP70_00675 [Thioclava sp. SK-1]
MSGFLSRLSGLIGRRHNMRGDEGAQDLPPPAETAEDIETQQAPDQQPQPAQDAPPDSANGDGTGARDWIAQVSGHMAQWVHHGALALPSGELICDDPSNGHDYLIRYPLPLPVGSIDIWSFTVADETEMHFAQTNLCIWLELRGTRPSLKGPQLDFNVDAGCFALCDLDVARDFVAFDTQLQDQGGKDSWSWLASHLDPDMPNFARWVGITDPEQPQMFLASTGTDGGFAAVPLYDEDGALSGLLIDIAGRRDDRRFIDTELPEATG